MENKICIIITSAIKYRNFVIIRLDRTIQSLRPAVRLVSEVCQVFS